MKKKVPDINHIALSAYNQKTAEDLAKYLHACAGYPVKETWVKAIAKGYYSTWPKLDRFKGPQWIMKHLPKSIITTMGHMKATRQGIRSTKKNNNNDNAKTNNEDKPNRERIAKDKSMLEICIECCTLTVQCNPLNLKKDRKKKYMTTHIRFCNCTHFDMRIPFQKKILHCFPSPNITLLLAKILISY